MAPKRRPPVVVKPQPSARKQRKKRLPESSSDKDSEAEETAVVVAESEPEAEDKASDDKEKQFLAKQKRARLNTFNMYFNDLSEDIQQQWIETNKPGCLQKREKRRDLLDFVVPKTSARQINPTARTISKNLLCPDSKCKRRRILV
jgi:DNA-binding TFAR19-related protein (PDSD5 family)